MKIPRRHLNKASSYFLDGRGPTTGPSQASPNMRRTATGRAQGRVTLFRLGLP